MIIYKTINLINNKIYVGSDFNNNLEYYGSGKLLRLAIDKYGKENFKKIILEKCNSKDELKEKEGYWIKKLNATKRDIGYNISDGYWGGDTWSNNPKLKEFKRKTSERLKGEGNPNYGKPLSKKHKEKISDGLKNSEIVANMKKDPVWRKKISDGLKNSDKYNEVVRSEERNKNVSKGRKNSKKFQEYIHSEDFKNKCSKWQKNKKRSDEYIQKFRETRSKNAEIKRFKKIQQIKEQLNQGKTIDEISNDLNVSNITINRYIKKYKL